MKRKCKSIGWTIVTLVVAVSPLRAEENAYQGGTAPPFNLWSLEDNWSLNVRPNETHDVTVTTPNATINMDYNPPGNYSILSFQAGVPGTLQLSGFNDINTIAGARYGGSLNGYTINVPYAEQFTSGSPFGQTGWANTVVERFEWSVGGGATVGVVGTIGGGRWTLGDGTSTRANLDVGYIIGGGPVISDPAALGTIDSGFGGPPYGPHDWTLNGAVVRAKRCQNLGIWNVNQASNAPPNEISAIEYFETGRTILTGRRQSTLWVATPSATANPGGLRVKDLLEAKFGLGDAPSIEAEKLLVDAGKTVKLAHGAYLGIRESSISGVQHSAFAPVSAVFDGTASLGSKLLYGNPAVEPERITQLEVQENVSGIREPALRFAGQSYISTQTDPDNDPAQELEIHLGVHLEIQAETMRSPGIAWHTGGVDILVLPSSSFLAADMENIAADCCNVFFTDVREPRCLKYWRNLTLKDHPEVSARLLDKFENYLPNIGSNPEAMYVREKVEGVFPPGMIIDLNQKRLYYGELVGDPAGLVNGVHAQLIKTRFGDFDGNCKIDSADYNNYLRPFVTSPGVVTAYPLGDFDGDCDIDLVDLREYRSRLGQTNTCSNLPPVPKLDCPSGIGPGGGAAAESGLSEGIEPGIEDDAAFIGQVLVDYLTAETLPAAPDTSGMTEEETTAALAEHAAALAAAEGAFAEVVRDSVEWLDAHLSPAEKATLVAQLSTATLTFEIPIAEDLAAEAVLALSD